MKPTSQSALLTDLYELTMAAAYFENGFQGEATFELFIRSIPPERGYLIAAGLEQALDFLENLHFEPDELEYLKSQPVFSHVSPGFFDYLKNLRFTGEVWAAPEGTAVFGEEPLLRVTAPILEAQVVETYLLSTITYQTMIASKAARVKSAADGKSVIEFGSRRAHGPEAGLLAARAAFIGGCEGTSNVEAGQRFGIPIFGTLAHSFIMAYEDETEAFQRFQKLFPEHAVLLVDTYDTMTAIEKIITAGLRPKSVRLDSGDLIELSQSARSRLDEAGLTSTKIFASGDLDEFAIADLLDNGAEIDAFGVGTALATSSDAPTLSGVYKLVDVTNGEEISYRAKFSEEKVTYPGRKQVFRWLGRDGICSHDVIACENETYPDARPLLHNVMRQGKRTANSPDLMSIQKYTYEQLLSLPDVVLRLRHPEEYSVSFSSKLQKLLELVRERVNAVDVKEES